MFEMSSDMKLHFDGNIGSLPLPGSDVKVDVSDTIWDGIVGFKGRVALGSDKKWYIPYYADVGTGQSDLTWQVLAGVLRRESLSGMLKTLKPPARLML